MTHQKNAAQAAAKILTYLGFAQAVSMEPGVDRRRDHIQSLIADAMPKLRALVADGALRKTHEFELRAMAANYTQGHCWDRLDAECTVGAADEIHALRVALVCARVAGGARMPPGYRVKVVDGHGYRITPPAGGDWVAHSDTPAGDFMAALLAAPQASEAQCSCPSGDGSLRWPCAKHRTQSENDQLDQCKRTGDGA